MPTTCASRATGPGSLDKLLRALASAQRREILRILGEATPDQGKTCCAPDELCACKLSERLGLAASTISHHMKLLCDAGLVGARKEGVWVYYTLRRDALRKVSEELSSL
jgi:ArsR family transcriptional regulator, arsenate/arsenite/antimonite-responsive transcriptional repressor